MTTATNDPQKQPAAVMALDPDLSDAQATLEQILNLDLTQCNLSVCLASKEEGDPQPRLRKIDMTEDAGNNFRDALNQALAPTRKAQREGDMRVLAFDPVQPVDEGTIEYLKTSTYESLQPQLERLKDFGRAANLHGYEHPFVDGLRFYSIIIEPRAPGFSEPIYYYRWYSHTFMLKDSSQHALRFFNGQKGTYDIITEPVFLFDRHVDCISYGGKMFILQKYYFYTIFDLEDELKKIARKALNELEKMDFIHNFDQFRFDCLKNRNKYRILSKIYLKPYFPDLSMDMLEPIITDYGRPVNVQWFGNKPDLKRKMIYNASQPWEILHVLDDQFWTSPMTEIDYQASGKNQIGKRTKAPKQLPRRKRTQP